MWRLSDRDQLALELDEGPPRNAEELKARLQRLGLGSQYRVRLTTNRTVVVSYSGGGVPSHDSVLRAKEKGWEGNIIFLPRPQCGARGEARGAILRFPGARAPGGPR